MHSLISRPAVALRLATHLALTPLLLFGLQGCDSTTKTNSSSASKPIESTDLSALSLSSLQKVSKPNCILDVDPGKIKKCKPELASGVHGISGELLIDGIRPDRDWTPMVAVELSSKDDSHKFRLKFNIVEYKTDADGKALLPETPFKGVAELWTDRKNNWTTELPIQIMPTHPFEFAVAWNPDQTLAIQLGNTAWKTTPIGFDINYVSIMGSGVLASTNQLAGLQTTAEIDILNETHTTDSSASETNIHQSDLEGVTSKKE